MDEGEGAAAAAMAYATGGKRPLAVGLASKAGQTQTLYTGELALCAQCVQSI